MKTNTYKPLSEEEITALEQGKAHNAPKPEHTEDDQPTGDPTPGAQLPPAPDAGTKGDVASIIAARKQKNAAPEKPADDKPSALAAIIASRKVGGTKNMTSAELIRARKTGTVPTGNSNDPRAVIFNRRFNKK